MEGQGLRVGKGGGTSGKKTEGEESGGFCGVCGWIGVISIHNISNRKAKKDPTSMSTSIYALHIYRLIDCGSGPFTIDGVDSR